MLCLWFEGLISLTEDEEMKMVFSPESTFSLCEQTGMQIEVKLWIRIHVSKIAW